MDTTNHRPDGIWIPFEILEARLDGVTLQIFMLVHSFTQNGKECYVSNEYLMEITGCTLSKVKSSLAKLKELGWIVQTKFDGRRRYLVSTLRWQLGFKQTAGDNSNHQPVENPTGRQSENQPHTINKNTINKNTIFSSSINIEEEQHENFEPSLNSKKKKEKTHLGGGAEHLHQRMVEIWDNHLKERFQTSISGLSKLGGVPANMAALKRIREYLYQSAIDRGLPTPDESTVKGFEYILQNKHKAGQFYDRAELTHTAKYLLDIIKELNNPTQQKNGNKSTDIITPEQAQQSFERYWRKKYGYTGSEDQI